ncbi:MAG TPA: TonB-dependent receptor [Candidatus Acidoferrales bacterium]|nr:TonB-dependent receptor [Candidatus Acidoferrales bacterium]
MSSFNSVWNETWGVRCRKLFQLLAVVFGVLLLCVPAFSQGNTGRILGTVVDQSGGTVSGATVSVVDTERGITRTLTTDDAGEYSAPNLTPSAYLVRVEAKGFKKLERQNVVLEVGKEVRVDVTLQPGAQEQTVTVTEAVPLVETTNATLGGTLENKEIADLPLNGRDFQNLLGLRPGVMLQVGGGPWTQSTNNVRPDESVWMIDGVINHNFYDHRPVAGMPSPITDGATILPLDSIQEFNLMENPKAEYGWDPGAVVNIGVKSGTNSLHGSAYGFYRSAAWDARNYFNVVPNPDGTCVLSSCAKTTAQLKQFGGSVGGPIKKDKLFFFANYEALRDLIGNVFGTTNGTGGVPETVPSPTKPSTASCVPAVLAVNANADCNTSMVDALNNLIAQGITPSTVTLALTGCTPGTSSTLAATMCTGGFWPHGQTSTSFLSTFPNTNVSDNGVAKFDYHINDKNTLNGLFIIGRYTGLGEDRGFINSIFLNGYPISTYTASGTWDYTPNSRMVNEFRFGYNKASIDQTNLDGGLNNIINTGAPVPGFPVVNINNADPGAAAFGQFGTWHSRPQGSDNNPYWDAQESLSYLVGKHALKFGYEWAHMEADTNIPDTGRGQISFADLQSFFAGTVSSGKLLVGNPARKDVWTSNAAFAQDDWRLTPKFMLNLGLRYSYFSPLREVNNLWANFDPSSPTGLVQQGQPGLNTLWKPDRGDFSPRFGFAYDLNGKGTTVVRGGFSIIYSEFSMIEWQQQNQFQNSTTVSLGANPTGACTVKVPAGSTCAAAGGSTLGGSIAAKAAGFKAAQLCWDPTVSACPTGQTTVFPSSGAAISCTAGSPCNLMGVDPNLKAPYVMNFSLGVTHAFTPDLSLEVGYVGDHGARLTGFSDINQCAPNVGNCVQPYANKFPYFNFINNMTNDIRSNYHSLQATLTKRMSHGVSFIAGYTFAHGLDSGSLNRFGLLPQNAFDPGAEYGNSDFDIRHRFTLTATYNIPGIKGFAQLLEGWQLNTIVTLQSGQPWLVNDYNTGPYAGFPNGFSGTGDNSDRWDFFGSPSDFQGTQSSIPFCKGFTVNTDGSVNSSAAKCTSTSGVSGVATPVTNSSTLISNCAKAPDPTTLAAGGCFANGNSYMTPPKAGTFGTMGRNIFRDSGYKDMDFSVFKNFTWKERYSAQFRLEMFNIFNHPVFANPYGAVGGFSGGNNDPSSPGGFGGTTGTPDTVVGNPVVGSGDSRTIQIGLKLLF